MGMGAGYVKRNENSGAAVACWNSTRALAAAQRDAGSARSGADQWVRACAGAAPAHTVDADDRHRRTSPSQLAHRTLCGRIAALLHRASGLRPHPAGCHGHSFQLDAAVAAQLECPQRASTPPSHRSRSTRPAPQALSATAATTPSPTRDAAPAPNPGRRLRPHPRSESCRLVAWPAELVAPDDGRIWVLDGHHSLHLWLAAAEAGLVDTVPAFRAGRRAASRSPPSGSPRSHR